MRTETGESRGGISGALREHKERLGKSSVLSPSGCRKLEVSALAKRPQKFRELGDGDAGCVSWEIWNYRDNTDANGVKQGQRGGKAEYPNKKGESSGRCTLLSLTDFS